MSSVVSISHMWLLNTQNWLGTEILSLFILVSLDLNLSSPKWLWATGLDSPALQGGQGRQV